MLTWQWLRFAELSVAQLYDVLVLRQAIFVVEQACPYLDADGLDLDAWHLLGEQDGRLAAYLRVLPPGVRFPEPCIGRVVVRQSERGRGLGRGLLAEGIRRTETLYPGAGIQLAAQYHLQAFYSDAGFFLVGEPYEEDGIRHVNMLRAPNR